MSKDNKIGLHDIPMPKNSRRKIKFVGRGSGSGHGKTSCRGHKGLKARTGAGGKLRIGFEGGQMPLIRRIPKRGFRSRFRIEHRIVNIKDLNKFRKGDVIDLVKSFNRPVKVLGDGELKKPVTVKAHSFSKTAAEKIKASGGSTEVVKKETGRDV